MEEKKTQTLENALRDNAITKEEFLGKYYDLFKEYEEYGGINEKKEILKKIIKVYGENIGKQNIVDIDKKINTYSKNTFNILDTIYNYLILLDKEDKEEYSKYIKLYKKYKEDYSTFKKNIDIESKLEYIVILYINELQIEKKFENDLVKIPKISQKIIKKLHEELDILNIPEDELKIFDSGNKEEIKNFYTDKDLKDLYGYFLMTLYNLGINYGYIDGEEENSQKYLRYAFKFEEFLLEEETIDKDIIRKEINTDFGEELKDIFQKKPLIIKKMFEKQLEEQKIELKTKEQEAKKQKAELESDLEKHNLETEKLKLRSNNNLEYHLIKSALSKLGQDNIDGYFEPKLNEIIKEVSQEIEANKKDTSKNKITTILENNSDYQIYKHFKDQSKSRLRKIGENLGIFKKDYPLYNKTKQKASEDDLDYILPAIRVSYLGIRKDIISKNMDKFDKLKDQYLKYIGGSKIEENRNLFKNEEIESIEKLYSKEMEFFKESNSNMEKIVTKFDIIMREKQDRDQKRKIFGKVMWFFSIESIAVLGGMGWYLFAIIHGGEQISTNNVILISIIISVTLSQITLMMYHIIKNLYILPNEQVEKMNIDKIFDITKILQDKIIDSSKK